jgi:hypothetical protein
MDQPRNGSHVDDAWTASESASATFQLHLRVPEDVDRYLRKLAGARGQTLSGAITYVLREYSRRSRQGEAR